MLLFTFPACKSKRKRSNPMIIKANGVMKIRVPAEMSDADPKDIVEVVRKVLNEEVFPQIRTQNGLDLSMQIRTADLRVSK